MELQIYETNANLIIEVKYINRVNTIRLLCTSI